jgi:hypothetical protein
MCTRNMLKGKHIAGESPAAWAIWRRVNVVGRDGEVGIESARCGRIKRD